MSFPVSTTEWRRQKLARGRPGALDDVPIESIWVEAAGGARLGIKVDDVEDLRSAPAECTAVLIGGNQVGLVLGAEILIIIGGAADCVANCGDLVHDVEHRVIREPFTEQRG